MANSMESAENSGERAQLEHSNATGVLLSIEHPEEVLHCLQELLGTGNAVDYEKFECWARRGSGTLFAKTGILKRKSLKTIISKNK